MSLLPSPFKKGPAYGRGPVLDAHRWIMENRDGTFWVTKRYWFWLDVIHWEFSKPFCVKD
jgi:hypothetical protein